MPTTGFAVVAADDMFRLRLPSFLQFPLRSGRSANYSETDGSILDDHFRSTTFRSDRSSFPSARPTWTRTTGSAVVVDDGAGNDSNPHPV